MMTLSGRGAMRLPVTRREDEQDNDEEPDGADDEQCRPGEDFTLAWLKLITPRRTACSLFFRI